MKYSVTCGMGSKGRLAALTLALAFPSTAAISGDLGACRWNFDWLGTALGAGSRVRALGAEGTAAGELLMPDGRTHAFMARDGVTTDLHPLVDDPDGSSSAAVVSDEGVVGGTAHWERSAWTYMDGRFQWAGQLSDLDAHHLAPVAVRREGSVLTNMWVGSFSEPGLAEDGVVDIIGEGANFVRTALPLRRGRAMAWAASHYGYDSFASIGVERRDGAWRWVDLPGFGMGAVSVSATDGRHHVVGQAACGGDSPPSYEYCTYVADLRERTQTQLGGWTDGELIGISDMQRGARGLVGNYRASADAARQAALFIADAPMHWTLSIIAPPGSDSSDASLINRRGVIYGSAQFSGAERHYLRGEDGLVWLDELVPALAGREIEAVGLNDSNVLAGNAVTAAGTRAFTLSCD